MKFDQILDLFLQPKCPICSRSTPNYLCVYCTKPLIACRSVQFCETKLPTPLFCWGVYDDALKRAIGTCKYQNQPKIATFLGQQMGETWQTDREALALKKLTVVPIPMHPEKQKKRGFNQAELLARGFCAITNMPCKPELLRRTKNTKPQMETKSKEERRENLAQAFVSPPQKVKYPVLIVDDIYTSGATIESAILSLTSQQIKVGAILVLARTTLSDR